MSEELEIRSRIIQTAFEMFEQYGFSKSTMEDIAEHLHISKKTLYKHFRNKEEILKEGFHTYRCDIENAIDSIINDTSLDFIEKLRKLMMFIAGKAKHFKSHFMEDLQKNHHEIYTEIQEFRRKNAYAKMSKLISEGTEQGIFRQDIDKNILVKMYTSSIQAIINPDTLAQLPLSVEDAFKNIITVLFEGIYTEKGREICKNEKINEKKETYDEVIL